MKTLNKAHFKKFLDLREKLNYKYKDNKEILSVLFILSGNEKLNEIAFKYVDLDKGEFNFMEMFSKEDIPSGLKILADLSVLVFSGSKLVDITELAKLDVMDFRLSLATIEFRYLPVNSEYETDVDNSSIIK